MVSFKGAHFVEDIILTCVRWYLAYPSSYRQVEELMEERGVSVDHATINRWVLKVQSSPGSRVLPPKAPSRAQLEHGRDLHPRQGSVAVSVSGQSISPARRLTFCSPSIGIQEAAQQFLTQGDPPPQRA